MTRKTNDKIMIATLVWLPLVILLFLLADYTRLDFVSVIWAVSFFALFPLFLYGVFARYLSIMVGMHGTSIEADAKQGRRLRSRQQTFQLLGVWVGLD
ncbi:MAG: hypothetical protein ABJN26_25380 [Stappiaceae bacterium]